jgi:hypothetical protein
MARASIEEEEVEDVDILVATVTTNAEKMLQRAACLMAEYEQCKDLWHSEQRGSLVGLKSLMQAAKSDASSLQNQLRLMTEAASTLDDGSDDQRVVVFAKRLRTSLQCSNIPSMEATWDVVKRCRDLDRLVYTFSRHREFRPCNLCCKIAAEKNASRNGKEVSIPERCPPKNKQPAADLVWVDAVIDGGAEWLRVVSMEERRLLMHMAQGGWDWEEDSHDNDSIDGSDGSSASDDDCDISLMVMTRHLIEAARANRHAYKPPRVHIVLTRIGAGRHPQVEMLLRRMEKLGGRGTDAVQVRVSCADSEFLTVGGPTPDLADALQNLLEDMYRHVTPVINLDCSIMVCLTSDVTNSRVKTKPWHRGDIARQIRDEVETGSSLVRHVYPVLRGRKLVCTRAAADRFKEIVAQIATQDEAARADIILDGNDGDSHATTVDDGTRSAILVDKLQGLSIHSVEKHLQLPIEVVDHDAVVDIPQAMREGNLPLVAEAVAADAQMTELNRDIFLYGWSKGINTMTANNTLAKQIVRLVEEHRVSGDETGPKLCVVPVTRALATKGKPRKDDGYSS